MKSSMKSSKKLALGVTLACAALGTTTTMAATEQQKINAIESGLGYLASTQTAGGYWDYGGSNNYDPAATGAAAYAMLTQYSHWGSNSGTYQTQVTNAINYLLNNATVTTVSTRNDGVNICPGGSGTCTGVYWGGRL